jgi:putative DNA primase/helicase
MVPTLIMDATLPSKLILQTWFPSVEIVGDISAAMPHVRVRQVLGAPITSKKLLETETDRNLRAIRQYVLKRWIECGRQKTLVICQKGVKDKLAEGMPPGIHLEHFNAIAGLDQYRDVRLLTTIGRTLPTPFNVEDAAGLLSGLRPARATLQASGLTWFDKVQRGIRLRNGKGLAVQCDQHPDPLAEAVRWQVCEAELIQAIGRGRGVNRTADTPLDIDILADVVLPVTVIQAEEWADPGKQWEMAGEGIWLDSPTDMAAAWPALWKDRTAARNWLERNGVSSLYTEKRHRSLPEGWTKAELEDSYLRPGRAPRLARLAGGAARPLAGFDDTGQSFEREDEVDERPDGHRVTVERLRLGGETAIGRVAVSCLRRHDPPALANQAGGAPIAPVSHYGTI